MKQANRKRWKICFFGHFGTSNYGNECTLQAILYHLRRYIPDAEVNCICSFPETAATIHNIAAVPISDIFAKQSNFRNPLGKLARKVFVGIPCELYRWFKAYRTLKGKDMLIVPGTGLLTDAYGLRSWGPYNIFKWSLIAKMCRCKLLFVGVGAGPLYSTLGRWFVKSPLVLADFRSYRDNASMKYLKSIGISTNNARRCPDLAFSLPKDMISHDDIQLRRRSIVGLGLMQYAGKYSVERPSNRIYLAYLENLVVFVSWLLAHEYDVSLLIGDMVDVSATREFRDLLRERLLNYDEGRITEEPILSVEQLVSQLAATDLVVGTRFHNLVLALLLGKPVISISFHHKCASLMREMGLSEYCQDINHLDADRLIEQFCDLEKNADKLKFLIKQKTEEFRKALDEQYNFIFKDM